MKRTTLLSSVLILTLLSLASCKKDETSPSITINGDNPIFLNLGENYTEPGATATDDKDGDISSKIEISHSINPLHVNEYVVNYSVSDKAGNKSSASRIVNIKANLLGGTYQATSDTKNYSLEVIGTSTFNRITFRNFGEFGNQNIFYSKIYGDSIAIDTKTISIGNNTHRIFNARGYYSKSNQTFKIDSVRYSETITPVGSTNGETFIRREVWTK
jgi:hypothetical protein